MSEVPEERRPKYFNAGPFYLGGSEEEAGKEAGELFFSRAKLQQAINYNPKDDDLFVVTYPKNGTTWTQHILFCLFNDGKPPKEVEELFSSSIFLELHGTKLLEDNSSKENSKITSLKLHLPYNLVPKNPKSKYIVVMRNPKDTVVSFYYHTKGMTNFYHFGKGSFDDFFKLFMEGFVDFGDYFDWIISWLPHLHDHNVLFLTYEGMKSDPEEAVRKIATFIGMGDKISDDLISTVVQATTVKAMKEVINSGMRSVSSQNDPDKETFEFIRKGIINDWKNIMTPEQSDTISAKFRQKAEEYPQLLTLWDDYSWLD
jgi:hypothetical protein